MYYYCEKCNDIYSAVNVTDNMAVLVCPKSSCGSINIFKIDELMIPIIMRLNELGYKTTGCCSDHVVERIGQILIAFDEPYVFPELPDGWHISFTTYDICPWPDKDTTGPYMFIEYMFEDFTNDLEFQIRQMEILIELCKWMDNVRPPNRRYTKYDIKAMTELRPNKYSHKHHANAQVLD